MLFNRVHIIREISTALPTYIYRILGENNIFINLQICILSCETLGFITFILTLTNVTDILNSFWGL